MIEGMGPIQCTDKESIRFFSLARYALLEALNAANVQKNDTVLMPAYICRDLLAPLRMKQLKIRWYDLTEDMRPLLKSDKWPDAKVVLAVNYFGFAQDLSPFIEYSKRTGAILIEDNAHGFLSQDRRGAWLGCRANIGIFSLRKTLRMPDGAALFVRDKGKGLAQLPPGGKGVYPLERIKAQLRLFPVIGEGVFRCMTRLIRAYRNIRYGVSVPCESFNAEDCIPGDPNPWHQINQVLEKYNDAHKESQRRKDAYLLCETFAKSHGINAVFERLDSGCVPYGFAFRSDACGLSLMRGYAQENGFECIQWPDLPAEVKLSAPEYYRDVYLVNFLW